MRHIDRWILPVLGVALMTVAAATPAFAQEWKKAPVVTFANYIKLSRTPVTARQTVPAFHESIWFERPPKPPAKRRFHLGSRVGQGFIFLTHENQTFLDPALQPATSLQDWQNKYTKR